MMNQILSWINNIENINELRLLNDFSTLRENLASGSSSVSQKCMHRLDGCIYNIKILKNMIINEGQLHRSLNEAMVLAAIEPHINILKYYDSWIENKKLHLRSEFCEYGSLQDYLDHPNTNSFTEDQIIELLIQMLRAIEHIHLHGIAHMDIKPANILLKSINHIKVNNNDDNNVNNNIHELIQHHLIIYKLADFGLAHLIKPLDYHNNSHHDVKRARSFSFDIEDGDKLYLAREIIQDDYQDISKADIFSLGVSIYQIILGKSKSLPVSGEEYLAIRDGKLKDINRISKELQQIILDMVQANPKHRPSASMLLQSVLKLKKSSSSLNTSSFETEIFLRSKIIQLQQQLSNNQTNN